MGTGIGDVPTKPSSYELERRGEMPRRKQSKAHPQGTGTANCGKSYLALGQGGVQVSCWLSRYK